MYISFLLVLFLIFYSYYSHKQMQFKNLASLLKAELASTEENNDNAENQYDFAIAAA